MKLTSTFKNTKGVQIVCDDAVFDPDLISPLCLDTDEKIFTFSYDFGECGNPLNLPFDVRSADFLAKVTSHDIHICLIVEPQDEINETYEDYINDMGDIEFDVRMTVEEKLSLLLHVMLNLISDVNEASNKSKNRAVSRQNFRRQKS